MNKIEALLKYSLSKPVPLILQTEVAECGLASMAMIAAFYGHELDMQAMRKRFSANLKGMNLQNLIDLSEDLELSSRALQCPLSEVVNLKLPCILHWDMNHFVVLSKVKGKGGKTHYQINDPSKGKLFLTEEEFSQHFTGICLEVTPTNTFRPQKEKTSINFNHLWTNIFGLKSGLFKLLILSLVLQVFVLLTPYYMHWVVDEVLVSFDESLLMVLGLGFALVAFISAVTNSIRSWLILRLSSLLNLQMGVNLLYHLLRLPMNYFESRHIGDIVSRFGSLSNIRERITSGFVETVVDGVMVISVLIMMMLFSMKLTTIVLAFILAYVFIRLALYQPLYRTTQELIQNSAKEQSYFLENIRGIQTIKLFGSEPQRECVWQNRYAEVINSEIRVGRLHISFDFMNKLLFGLENVIVIYFSAKFVMAGNMTVGMIFAFIAYKSLLIERIANLVEQIIQFKMMRLHLDRIADIVLTPVESNRENQTGLSLSIGPEFKGELTLENVSFSYDDENGGILKNINLSIKPGSSIAIAGKSGSGKTTLMKIMLGLLKPTSGRVLIDGQDITQIGLKLYRKSIAAVMQNDTLLAGSIRDNISFFDPQENMMKTEQCAKLASIHDDIIKMTMGYNTVVGDMGANLSGGQVQRILFARALYQSPCVLFLDEATSHLDKENEAKISEKCQNLSMTRVMIAHRKETLDKAQYVYMLDDGKLTLKE